MTKKVLEERIDGKTEMEAAIEHILSSPAGILFFKKLMDETGYGKSCVMTNSKTGEAALMNMAMLNATQQIWIKIRRMIPDDKLFQIEIQGRNSPVTVVDNTTRSVEKWQMEQDRMRAQQNPTPTWDQLPNV